MKKLGKNLWLILFAIISIFFLISGILSALNYSNVLLYRNKVINENPNNVTAFYDEKSNSINFSFIFKNPTPFSIDLYSLSALFFVNNTTVSTFQRSYYYFQEFPLQIKKNSEIKITFSSQVYSNMVKVVKNSTSLNVTIQIVVRFSGFSYYYENPGENYSPERYYLTEMVIMQINWSGKV